MSSGPRTTCWTDKPATHTTSAEFPVLPASEVTYQDLKDMFDLHLDPGRGLIEISQAPRLRVPESLEGEFAEELVSLAHSPENVDGCYFDTRTLLFHCLREEMCFAGHNFSYSTLFATPKLHLDLAVTHKGIRKTLTAGLDYQMRLAEDEVAPVFVVLQAKSPNTLSMCLAECLTAMAMAHEIRKKQGYQSTDIYGVVADGRGIEFLRIGEDTKWCLWRPHRDWGPQTKDKIYTVLRLIIRDTARSASCQ
ncbi:hypothetical protein BJX68DRAFT_78159 [Aspergillus pseudodeflectus]|uniref:Uncharacterized protein n=1 Tax=Aspergillus pseudodeflectus TaxID=176178 RepID=A0ABR4L6U8_9EURO